MLGAFEKKILDHLNKLDVEALRKLVREAWEEKGFYHRVFDAILEALIVVDREGNLVHLNRFGERILNIELDKLKGRPLLPAVQDKGLYNLFKSVLEDQSKVLSADHFLIYPAELFLNVSAFALTVEGRIEGTVFLLVDITENRNLHLKKTHEESIQKLAALTAGVAHEIKNPLGSLDLHLQLMNRFLKANQFKGKEEVEDLARIIGDEISRLDRIVNDFLFSVRPIKAQLRPDDLNVLVRETCAFMQMEFEETGVELVTELDAGLPLVAVDKNYFKQAMLNMLKNALQAVEESGRIEDGRVKVSTQSHPRPALVISDNGIGMPQETLNQIFEPFFTTKPTGTGLGLTIVYKILKEHGAEIILSSHENEGTEFRIEFPAAAADMKLLAEPAK